MIGREKNVEKSMALFYDHASDKLELGNINFEKINLGPILYCMVSEYG